MKKIIGVIGIFTAFGAHGQTVHYDSVEKKSYVNITPVRWKYNEPICDRLYLIESTTDYRTQCLATYRVGYVASPNTYPHFVDNSFMYTFSGIEYDSVSKSGQRYIMKIGASSNNLTITE